MHRTHNNYGSAGQGMESQMGNQMGNQIGNQMGQQPGSQWGQQAGSQWGQQSGPQWGSEAGNQMGSPAGAQWGHQAGQLLSQPMGQGFGQQATMGQMAGQQMTPKFGAAEVLQAHEVLCQHIDGINQFELCRPHIQDQRLMQILDSQVQHMFSGYQNLVNFLQNQGMSSAIPYRAPKSSAIKYGLRQPSPVEPNTSETQMDDRDVASSMMYYVKSGALQCTIAALECANPELRNIMTNCAVSSINQAYEIFQYMNQKGMYQVPTLAEQTTQTMINTYQAGTQPSF